MGTTRILSYTLLAAAIMCCCASCKEDDAQAPDIYYAVSLDGYTVTFTNETTGAVSYDWDFGDGETSTEESPVHTYPGKGKYVPTLYATNSAGVTAEGSTVINISKFSAIDLDDNALSDWDAVTANVVVSGSDGGVFRTAKFDYNSTNIYFYFEIATTLASADIFDFYLDTDNDATTGYSSWMFTGAGCDVLLEGAMLTGSLDPFYFSGSDQSSFSWTAQTISEFYEIGTIVEEDGLLKCEGTLKRSKLRGLINTGIKLGVAVTKSDWSATIGTMPDLATAAFYLDMSE